MPFYNLVVLTGRIVNPPQRYYRPDGSSLTQFAIEVKEEDANPSGRTVVNVVAFDTVTGLRPFELREDQLLTVEGRLKQRRWRTPEGRTRNRIEVIATHLWDIDDQVITKEKE